MAEEDEYIWKGEIPVPKHLIDYIDEAVRDALPPGTQFHGISPSGVSYWARTAKIDATDVDGNKTPLFIKIHKFEHGKSMVSSEYTAAQAMYSAYPELVPEPIAWGTYKAEDEVYFLLMRFYDLSGDIPDVSTFPALLARLQTRPEAKSKTGEFGFPIITYGGRNPSVFPLSKSWEATLTGCLEAAFIAEEQTHGPDPEMTRLKGELFLKVIPRLVRPLESEGRRIEPILCHGDMWDGNVSVDKATGKPKIFDPTPLYAHREYELAPWFIARHKMTDAYVNEYKKHIRIAEPQEDFHDRGILYSIAIKDMKYLVKKYPHGYDGYARERGLEVGRTRVEIKARI
ncbi:hypothetical protein DHEL01_v206446 [Diaporthe helianthi]|uniref:protein-ribulosamine 3-kinase n=1 Tax=Diaporthe helianthi TaxID=158607 RepID=A0A2P5HY34_DIAHE|nr:hypothetical protein DHEL01_v206446 [Diaporthe helianthi]